MFNNQPQKLREHTGELEEFLVRLVFTPKPLGIKLNAKTFKLGNQDNPHALIKQEEAI
jgi:hypothetical protein